MEHSGLEDKYYPAQHKCQSWP